MEITTPLTDQVLRRLKSLRHPRFLAAPACGNQARNGILKAFVLAFTNGFCYTLERPKGRLSAKGERLWFTSTMS